MSLIINEECINCDVCELKCPNKAISMGKNFYEINPEKCTECIGHFNTPQCQLYCPVEECIEPDIRYIEKKDDLFEKYLRLQKIKE